MPSLSVEEWLAFVVLLLNALLSFLAQRRSVETGRKLDTLNGQLSSGAARDLNASRASRDDR